MKSFKSSFCSRCFGRFASCEFVPFFQKIVNSTYVRLMGVDLKEFKEPHEYKSLNRLFTRELLQKRAIDEASSSFISPCDSLISDLGDIKESKALSDKRDELYYR